MEPYPEHTDPRQAVTKATELGIAMLPIVGSPLQVIFNEAAGRKLQERRTLWFNALSTMVASHEDKIGTFEHLMSQDVFMDALTTASQIADRTSRDEKLTLLRNAVVNSVMPNAPDDDTQQLFFDLLDRFTPTHVRLLKLLSDPPGWFDRYGIPRPEVVVGGKAVVIKAGVPELADRQDLIDRYASALTAAGLVSQSLTGVMSVNGIWARATTPLAAEFLAFIEKPETDA